MIASAPAASRRSASFGVIPTPSATFSPLTMQTEASSSARSDASRSSSASRPGRPTTSPMKRMFRLRERSGSRVHVDRDVVAASARVLRERLPLDGRHVDDRSELGGGREHRAADRKRRIGLEVAQRDDQRRSGARSHVDPRAVRLAVDHEVRDRDDGAVDRRVHVGARLGADVEHLGAGPALELVPDRALLGGARDPAPEPGEQALVGLAADGAELDRAAVLAVEPDRGHGLAGDRQPDLEVPDRRQGLRLRRHAARDGRRGGRRRDRLGRVRAEGGQDQGDECESGDDPDDGQAAGAVLRALPPGTVPGRSPGARRGHRGHRSGRFAAPQRSLHALGTPLNGDPRGYDQAHDRAFRADDPGPALDPARRPAGGAPDHLDARRHPRARALPLPHRVGDRVPAQSARARPAAAAPAARARGGARLPPLRHRGRVRRRSRSAASSSTRPARRRTGSTTTSPSRTRAARPAPSRTSTGSSTGSTRIASSGSRSRSRRPTGPTTSARGRSRSYTQDALSFAQGAAFSIVVTLFNLVLIVVIAIYMLLDMERLERLIDRRFPPGDGPTAHAADREGARELRARAADPLDRDRPQRRDRHVDPRPHGPRARGRQVRAAVRRLDGRDRGDPLHRALALGRPAGDLRPRRRPRLGVLGARASSSSSTRSRGTSSSRT